MFNSQMLDLFYNCSTCLNIALLYDLPCVALLVDYQTSKRKTSSGRP